MRLPDGEFLLLIDASSFIHRSYHVAKKVTLQSDGSEIGAIIGFCWTMMKLFRLNKTALKRRPSHGAIVLDTRGRNFRHDLYPLYKANRQAYEAGLEAQLPRLPGVAAAFNIPCIAVPGFEADDILATYASKARERGLMTVVASSDKDLMQLIDEDTLMYDAMADRDADRFDNLVAVIGVDEVFKKWGVWPEQMVDFQSLVGDAVDNIPGCPKIGAVKAAQLLGRFGDVGTMFSEGDWGGDTFPNQKDYQRIMENREEIMLSRDLARLRTDVEVPLSIDELKLKGARSYDLKDFFRSIEAPQLVNRVDF